MEASFGPWQLERRVYVGEHADVTEAIHARGGPAIALKRLHAHAARDPGLRALFDRECAVACGVAPHPAVVRGIDAGEVDGRPWLAMPLVPGEDLRALVARGDAVDPVKLGVAVCAALAHLHGAGWIHGDCTPANLLVTLDERSESGGVGATRAPPVGRGRSPLGIDGVVLCDLGVARPPGEPGPMRGTHAYMAPEQVRGDPWTSATDLWALGVVLWELASGARLFLRDAPWLTMAAVVEHAPAPLADPRLDAIVAPLLQKDPEVRPASAEALAEALAALG